MVKSIAVFSGKGGVGKSTLAAALAQQMVGQGNDTVLIDCDPQLTISDWGDRRDIAPTVINAQLGRVPQLLQKYPYAVIDTPGALVGRVDDALAAVDLILVVTGDRQPELDAVPATLQVAAKADKPVIVVLNRLHHAADPEPVRQFITNEGFCCSPMVIRERAQHYRAWAAGRTAVEHDPTSTAAEEIRRLWAWLKENG